LKYLWIIFVGTDLNSKHDGSSSSTNNTVMNLLQTDNAVNCCLNEEVGNICPFVPASHLSLMKNIPTTNYREPQEPRKEFVKLLVEHEADVNMANHNYNASSEILDNDFLLLNSARKLLLEFGNDVNLDNEENKDNRDNPAHEEDNAEHCTFLKWLMMNPGSQVNNLASPDCLWQQEIFKLKLRRLIVLLTASGNEVNSS